MISTVYSVCSLLYVSDGLILGTTHMDISILYKHVDSLLFLLGNPRTHPHYLVSLPVGSLWSLLYLYATIYSVIFLVLLVYLLVVYLFSSFHNVLLVLPFDSFSYYILCFSLMTCLLFYDIFC